MLDDKRIKHIIHYYGNYEQINVAIEELSELIKELCKCRRSQGDRDHTIEEIADVTIMLEQLKEIFKIDEKTLNKVINYKLNRTIERIDEEQLSTNSERN